MDDPDLQPLLARTALGDRAAFRTLYERAAPCLFAVCVRVLQDRAEAEAALGDAFVKIWRYAERQPASGAAPMTWMMAIARNRAIERVRQRPAHAVLTAAEAVADATARADLKTLAAGEGRRLAACLAGLGERPGRILRAAWFGGVSVQALAERDGAAVATVRANLREAIADLRQCVAHDAHDGTAGIEAAEYVLALMDERERRVFEIALLDDPDLAGAVWRWEARLSPLGTVLRRRAPPARVRRRLERSLFGGGQREVRRAERRAARYWRGLAGLFATLAVAASALSVLVLVRPQAVIPPVPQWIAAIERAGGGTALARLGEDDVIVAGPFPEAATAGSAQLWLVPPDGSPTPVGLLAPDGPTVLTLERDEAALVPGRTRLVVTLEPEGGSPTGRPTGPTIGAGALTRI